MLELAVLGLLKEQPLHGYDLRKRLREDFGPMSNLSFGSLYPALARLESSGAVRVLQDSPNTRRSMDDGIEKLPLTGSLGGERATLTARRATAIAAAGIARRTTRSRKVYAITDRGNALFEQLLDVPDARDEGAGGFSLRLAFARHLTPQARLRLLERRRFQLLDRIQSSTRMLQLPSRELDHYERSIAEHTLQAMTNDLAWVEQLLEQEQAHFSESVPTRTNDFSPPSQDKRHRAAARTNRIATRKARPEL